MSVKARAALGVAGALGAAVLLWRLGVFGWALATAVEAQRALQGALAGAARALAQGDAAAVWSLAGLSALYGLAHAAGPGHGKALLGAAAVAGAERPLGLAALAAGAALAQGLAAIVFVYGGLAVLSLSPMAAMTADATLFAPIGYAAAGAFGLLFAWRGLRLLFGRGDACCGHHASEPSQRTRWRERTALVAAVAARLCAGAMIVLAIAWMAQAPWAGVAAAGAMALGVAAVTAAVALGGFAFRDAALVAGAGTARVAGGLQVAAGGALCAFSAAGLA
jgi:ABC-type nickel/cobalt efflux system permease component RcnA